MPAGGGPARSPHGEGPARACRDDDAGATPLTVLDDGRARLPASGTRPLVRRPGALRARPGRVPPGPRRPTRPPASCGRGRCGSTDRRGCPTARPTTSTGTWSRASPPSASSTTAAVDRDAPRPARRRRRAARTGTAALVALVAGTAGVPDAPAVPLALLDKPAGQPYATFRPTWPRPSATRPGTACWMRQMTLGPGPEFVVVGDRERLPPVPWPVTALDAALVG